MSMVLTQPVTGPRAWRGAELGQDGPWLLELTPAEQREIAIALAHAVRTGTPMLHWQEATFPLDGLREKLRAIAHQLRDGLGFTILRGLDISNYSDEEVGMIYWGLGLYLGEPLGQNPKGDLLGHVFDQGRKYGGLDVRGYETSAYLPYHTDSCDFLGLMCLRQGLSGGLSSLVSSVSVHNAILAEHPEYLGLLYNGFYYIRREEALGGKGVSEAPVPVFGQTDGIVSCRYLRNQINAGAVKRGVPLTAMETEALDFLDAQTQREDLRLDFMLRPGDMEFCNNYTVLHSRTEFADGPERSQQRHMLRLWLKFHERWPVSEHFAEHRGYVLTARGTVLAEA
ncbi:TfdA family taurine catabolism dioxygenase TauD [Humitalea rosea]|uniref:TfdA family taurine catabolism dioxygenase TauD n=1 Tax=Humitalea rosea TaxID=990373 RepID=A0A2W7IE93_9PROT|nr:TauD/TfdA family dioxygenase [Humitalea rosea]PZW44779.1 TfdA family taurine catabolism dioxygenase TauD [Humitalea rosea]